MKSFLRIKFLFSVLFAISSAAFWLGSAEAAQQAENITLSWTGNPKTSQTITWQTVVRDTAPYVEYCEADAPDVMITAVQLAKADEKVFVTDEGERYVYSATLQDLRPGMRYVYRIGDKTQWTADGSFRTEKEGNSACKFLLFGDSQSINYEVWQNTVQAAYRSNRDADFFINAGDLVDNGQKYSEWEAWFKNAQGVLNKLPLMPVVGNHETYTPERKFSMPMYFTQQFTLPENGPEGLKEQAYSFDYGNAHFVVLDSQFGEERAFMPDSLERQKKWLQEDLAATDKLWKIVVLHRAPYHNRVKEEQPDKTAAFVPIFEEGGVDVVFTAHDHVCARTPMMRGGQPAETGGVVYMTTGRSGTKTYDTVGKKAWNSVFYNPIEEPTYSVIKIEQGIFYAQVMKASGEVIDEWVLTKSK